jgi:mitogen-activated protein kinase kinase kinase
MSSSSKRMSFITELRSKRDRSDTASLMTVDQITAEVESRRESLDVDRDTDDWTKVNTEDGEDLESTLAEDEVPNEVFDEEEETLMDHDEEEAASAETSRESECCASEFHSKLQC